MLLQIEKIKINKRIRIDIGDLDALKESLEKFGQFHPITVNSELESKANELGVSPDDPATQEEQRFADQTAELDREAQEAMKKIKK